MSSRTLRILSRSLGANRPIRFHGLASFPGKQAPLRSSHVCPCSTPGNALPPRIRQFSSSSIPVNDSAAVRIQQILTDEKVEDAEEFFFQMHNDKSYIPTKEHVAMILQAWLKAPHQAEAFLKRIHELYQEHGYEYCQPDRKSYDLVLQEWRDLVPPSAKRAQALFDYMQDIGIMECHVNSCNIVLQAWAKVKIAEGAQEMLGKVLEKKHPVDVETFLYTLQAWSKSKSPKAPQRADALLEEMKRLKLKPSALCYLRVMECWVKSNKKEAVERSEALLAEIRRLHNSDKSDPTILQTAMFHNLQAYAKIANAHRAEDVLLDFVAAYSKNQGVAPTLPMFISVLSTWSKSESGRRGDRAQKLLLSMNKHGEGLPKPDVVCYTAVLHCWAGSNKPNAAERAESLLKRMRESKTVQPNILSYTCVLHAWSRSKDPEAPLQAERVFQEILDRGLQPDRLTFGAIITAWSRSTREDAVEKAEGYLQRLKDIYAETKDPSCLPSVAQYTATIQAWATHVKEYPDKSREAIDRVEVLLNEMLESEDPQMRPNTLTYASVLKTLVGARRLPDRCDRAESLLRVMEQEGAEISPYILNIARKCCPKQDDKRSNQSKQDDEDSD